MAGFDSGDGSQGEWGDLSDKETCLTVMKQNGNALRFASDKMKGDSDVVLVAVKQNGYSLRYAKKKQRNDLALATAAVDQNGLAMCHVGMELRAVSLYAHFLLRIYSLTLIVSSLPA